MPMLLALELAHAARRVKQRLGQHTGGADAE
jgi:hypothetical protein